MKPTRHLRKIVRHRIQLPPVPLKSIEVPSIKSNIKSMIYFLTRKNTPILLLSPRKKFNDSRKVVPICGKHWICSTHQISVPVNHGLTEYKNNILNKTGHHHKFCLLFHSINSSNANFSNPETAQWLGGIDNDLHKKISKTGLVPARKTSTLKQYLPAYIARLENSKETKDNKMQTTRTLYAKFGKDRNPATIIEDEAKEYRTFLCSHKMDKKGDMIKS